MPVGYMPDLAGERNAPFAITLCSIGGITTLQLDLAGDGGHTENDSFGGETCPFGLNLAQELLPAQDAPPLAGVVNFPSSATFVRKQVLPPLPALGPPLGSRAPPLSFEFSRA